VNSKRRGIIVTRSSAEAEARQFFESAYTKAITNDDPFEKQLKQKEQGIQVGIFASNASSTGPISHLSTPHY
jgi:hypothetical protein